MTLIKKEFKNMTIRDLLEDFNQPMFDADGSRYPLTEGSVRRMLTKIEDLI